MIELTTGVVFLMSSLYGNAQVTNDQVYQATSDNAGTSIASTSSVITSKISDMEAYLRKEFADEPILVDIARCESNFNQFNSNGDVVRGRVDRDDIGLLQINERYQGPTAKLLGMDIYSVEGNVAYAKHLYAEQGTKPWASSSKCWGAAGQIAKSN